MIKAILEWDKSHIDMAKQKKATDYVNLLEDRGISIPKNLTIARRHKDLTKEIELALFDFPSLDNILFEEGLVDQSAEGLVEIVRDLSMRLPDVKFDLKIIEDSGASRHKLWDGDVSSTDVAIEVKIDWGK